MGHKCFISFKTEDIKFKNFIQNNLDIDMIDKSLDEPIDSENQDYILQKIRQDYLSDSTVTIFLIGEQSQEISWVEDQTFIKRELQASLYNGEGNTRNGILGVVLPSMETKIYLDKQLCSTCGEYHSTIKIDDHTVIKEFSHNYYLPNPKGVCSWSEDDKYCVLVKWSDFVRFPEYCIDLAFQKREHQISKKVRVYPE
ncbi:MAG: TIR domain-containing protein [Bacteroidia bacterium]